jgi:hypothetical protein
MTILFYEHTPRVARPLSTHLLKSFTAVFAMENPKFSSVLEFWECILNQFAFRDSYAGIHTPAVQKFTRGGASL